MWAKGLVDEVAELAKVGLREAKTSKRAIGYAQALGQLDGELTEQEAKAQTLQLTSRYARRQMSWFRRDKRIQWFDYQSPNYTQDATRLSLDWLESNEPDRDDE
jgi:tRNA dimethylallyltransferase